MDTKPGRRFGKTYGKSNKTVHVHDLFDLRNAHGGAVKSTSTRTKSTSPVPVDLGRIQADALPPKLSRRSRPIHKSQVQENVSDKNSYVEDPDVPAQDPALFDVESSDEELTKHGIENYGNKKRRIARPLRALRPGQTSLSTSTAPKRETTPTGAGRLPKPTIEPKPESESASSMPPSTAYRRKTPSPKKPSLSAQLSRQLQASFEEHALSPSREDFEHRPLVQMPEKHARAIERTIPKIAEPSSDRSSHSTASERATPKRKRPVQISTTAETSSPSELGVGAVNLVIAPSPAKSSPGFSSDESALVAKPRRRLIDRLDAPSKSAGHTSDDHSSDTMPYKSSEPVQKSANPRKKLSKTQNKPGEEVESISTSEATQSRRTWAGKARTTYATQRSHLSDMVDQLDGLDAPSSQQTARELLMQPPTSSLASQLELEDEESDDHAGNSKLKSIHELRQSGANKRFDREIDTLLEDVNTTDQFSKALRLQALMRLVKRLAEASFLRQFMISGRIQRLTALTTRPLDLSTSILLVLVFYLVTKSEEVTPDTLRLILRSAVDLAPSLLDNSKPFSKIAKERKENLSKATANDIADFEADFSSRNGVTPESDHIYPDLITLHVLEKALRNLIQLGDTSARFSTSTYTCLLDTVQFQARDLQEATKDTLGSTKAETALSLLELCSIMVDDANLHIADSKYHALGTALADMMDVREGVFEQNVLRVAVSLSNNKPAMCGLLGNTALTDRSFDIVNKNFLGLSIQAEHEHSLDESKLNSVVLALGCLLNFAECDASLRIRLAHMSPGESNYIEQLVSLFNVQVSKVDEAMTQEQSQVLVAFGYLSMLLCTLSVEPLIRQQVTRLLEQKSFDDLCRAGETFFSHLRTLEAISEDDSSLSTFTARFSAILDTIRSSRG